MQKEQLLAQVILDYITLHPERHSQSSWAKGDLTSECGTTACIAGYAILFSDDHRFHIDEDGDLMPTPEAEVKRVTFAAAGAELLGLDAFDREYLFYNTDNADARKALGYLARGEEIDWLACGVYRDKETWVG